MFTIGLLGMGVPSLAPGVVGWGDGVAELEGMVASVGAGASLPGGVPGGVLGSEAVPELPELLDGDRVLGVQATINSKIHK
jgi:hypothetical protein